VLCSKLIYICLSYVRLEAHKASAKSQIENIKSATKPLNLSLLDEQIRRLRDEISAREQIGKIIEYQNLGNAEGFSGALDSLAEHSISTIALKEISLLDGGRFLKMRGETYQPKDIATYISTLSEEPYFSDTQFGVLNVSNIKNNRRVHEFSLGFEAALSLANSGGGEFYGDVSK